MCQKMLRVLLTCCLFIGVAGLSTEGVQETKAKPVYNQVLEKLGSLQPTGNFEVRIGTEKEIYQIGDPFEVRFMASQDCYAILMDIGTNGDITFLLPNRQFPDNKIAGGKVYSTAFDLKLNTVKIGPPKGVETISLFCSPEKLDLFETDFSNRAYYTITAADEQQLKLLLERLNQLEQREWTGSSAKIGIETQPPTGTGRDLFKKPGTTGATDKFWPPIKSGGSTGKTDNKPKE